jgi:hypothetical protein
MIAVAGPLTPARILWLAPHAFALASCSIAWARARRAQRATQPAAALTALEAAFVLDRAFNGRWLLHNLLARLAMADHLYAGRSGPQHLALYLLACAAAAGGGIVLWRFRGRPGAAVAACGGVLSVSLWWVEVISLHAVDGLLYHSLHGVIPVKLAWTACSLMTGAGILWDASSPPAHAGERNNPAAAPPAPLSAS